MMSTEIEAPLLSETLQQPKEIPLVMQRVKNDDVYRSCIGDDANLATEENAENDIIEEEVTPVRVYRQRWFVLTLFSLSSATSAILWITFAPIASLTETYYDTDSTRVNTLSIVFMVAYLPMTLGSSWFFQKFGIRVGFVTACGLNCVSGLVRFLSTESNESPRSFGYSILLVGQTVGAMAQPFFTNMPARIGALWFPTNERDLAVVIGSTANIVGIGVGTILPAFYTVDDESASGESVCMFDLLLAEFIWTALVFGLVALCFRERPPCPPSISESTRVARDQTVVQELRTLFGNKDFNILVVCFGVLGLGLFNCLTTVIEQLIGPAGYSAADASLFSGLLLGCGLVSAVGVGFALDRTHMYNPFLKVGFVSSGIIFIIMPFLLRPDNLVPLAFVFGAMGMTMLPLLPLSFECGIECTYPISEDLSSGVLMSSGQISGILYITVVGALLDKQPLYGDAYVLEPAYIVILVSCVLFVFVSLFFNGRYLRLEEELDVGVHEPVSIPSNTSMRPSCNEE